MMMNKLHLQFARAGDAVFALSEIALLDFSHIEKLEITIHLKSGTKLVATEIHAIELALLCKPQVLENKRLKWPRHTWALHNLVGHPLMQLCAFLRLYKLAFWFHDATVPKPLGRYEKK